MDNSTPSHPLVPQIREASRILVREFGFMSPTIAGTDLSPSMVHAVIEINSSGSTTASTLCKTLNLDRSSVSRMLTKLVETSVITEKPNILDGRQKLLSLTEEGSEIAGRIDKFASDQVMGALRKLPADSSPEQVLDGIRAYASALKAQRIGQDVKGTETIIISGYHPGLLGRCIGMHMQYYSRTLGFGAFFEALLATGLGEFLPRLDSPKNEVWMVTDGEKILGTIFIDGEDLGENKAHLRYFIVDDSLRNRGFGRKLIQKAMDFVDEHGYEETHLYTVKGLDAARSLYEASGFILTKEAGGTSWGKEMVEQHFVRPLRAKVAPL